MSWLGLAWNCRYIFAMSAPAKYLYVLKHKIIARSCQCVENYLEFWWLSCLLSRRHDGVNNWNCYLHDVIRSLRCNWPFLYALRSVLKNLFSTIFLESPKAEGLNLSGRVTKNLPSSFLFVFSRKCSSQNLSLLHKIFEIYFSLFQNFVFC